MADEKWCARYGDSHFYEDVHGMVTRTFAKMCPELGVERSSFTVHHKSHVRKVMGHATVGICFTDSPELGCSGYVVSLNRCQGFKVCRKTTKEVTKNALTGRKSLKPIPLRTTRVTWSFKTATWQAQIPVRHQTLNLPWKAFGKIAFCPNWMHW